jgi:hypothetical protein
MTVLIEGTPTPAGGEYAPFSGEIDFSVHSGVGIDNPGRLNNGRVRTLCNSANPPKKGSEGL